MKEFCNELIEMKEFCNELIHIQKTLQNMSAGNKSSETSVFDHSMAFAIDARHFGGHSHSGRVSRDFADAWALPDHFQGDGPTQP